MNGREKIEAAFSKDGSTEFGAVICYEDIYIRDHWQQLSKHPWWYAFSPDLEQSLAWRQDVIPAIGQDWLYLPDSPSRAFRKTHQIVEAGGGVYLLDRVTGEREELTEPVVAGWDHFERRYSGHVDWMPQSADELEEAIPLRARFDRAAFEASGQGDLAQMLLNGLARELYPIEHIASPLWSCYYLWGFEGIMEMIIRRPELVKTACQRYLQRELEAVHLAAALGVRGIWIEDCLTDMIHPRDFSRLNIPFVGALVEEIRTCGMHSIHYFCSNPAGKLELLLSTGLDALALEESKKGFTIDIQEIAEIVDGRCALLGNLDAIHLLPHASEEDLRGEIARQMAAGRKNRSRFVLSTGSPITPSTTPEQGRRYCALAHELGR